MANVCPVYELCFPKGVKMANTDTIMDVMFALSGIVIVVGLLIHYTRPGDSGTKPNKPRSTLSGVIQLLLIVIGLMVAFALWDAFVVSMLTRGSNASPHYFATGK